MVTSGHDRRDDPASHTCDGAPVIACGPAFAEWRPRKGTRELPGLTEHGCGRARGNCRCANISRRLRSSSLQLKERLHLVIAHVWRSRERHDVLKAGGAGHVVRCIYGADLTIVVSVTCQGAQDAFADKENRTEKPHEPAPRVQSSSGRSIGRAKPAFTLSTTTIVLTLLMC